MNFKEAILEGIPANIPPRKSRDKKVNHAPVRKKILSIEEKKLAIKNALRYFLPEHHRELAKEFYDELEHYGRIYMYRYMPDYKIKARSIDEFPHKSTQAAAIMLMLSNNLDHAVAQHPEELITYGGNGAVFQNWAQYRLAMQYLANMTDEQTLVLYSGHPLGLFPSHPEAPRAVISNGMVIPNYSAQDDYERMNALGVSQYGQMTAGSFMYIGPQGIVHGTTITVLNAGRMLGNDGEAGLKGKLYVTSGLGGMSGAQPKATVIAGGVCLIAEVNGFALEKRKTQGWVDEVFEDKEHAIERAINARANGEAVSIAYHGNIVDLWESLADQGIMVDMGSDQTSLHNPYSGGYYPVGISFDEANEMMHSNPTQFKKEVQKSLRRHVTAINRLANQGMFFWDYGNAFLLESGRAGADVFKDNGEFKYQSYVQAIMGPKFFDYGFGPFRWVCSSSDPADLAVTDKIAIEVLETINANATDDVRDQLTDNIHWIKEAGRNNLIVGSQARILYADSDGRIEIALAFNNAIRKGQISAPVILGRDHHDVSGTDSPFRETSNIYDGSSFTADMAIQNVIGDACRGATWVSIHNGGGVGWGEVINGGFGMVLDGSEAADERIRKMLHWDVNNGIARRSWARNNGAIAAIEREMERTKSLQVTIPSIANDLLIDRIVRE